MRHAFLFGMDSYSGKNYEYRSERVHERIEFLSGLFGMEIFAYVAMSNHLHLDGPDSPFQGVDTDYYLRLVEWTGQNLRDDKPRYIPVRLETELDGCSELVTERETLWQLVSP